MTSPILLSQVRKCRWCRSLSACSSVGSAARGAPEMHARAGEPRRACVRSWSVGGRAGPTVQALGPATLRRV